MDDDDELLDLVDKNDKKIGTILRSEIANLHNENSGFLRAAEVLIINSNGRLWIPRRTMHKRIAPGGLDYSMGCHVSAGETYIEAAVRELNEELNMDVNPKSLQLLNKFAPLPEELAYIRCVYLLKSDEAPKYNPEDFTGFEWITPEELLKRLKKGEPAKRSLKPTIEYLIQHNK